MTHQSLHALAPVSLLRLISFIPYSLHTDLGSLPQMHEAYSPFWDVTADSFIWKILP